MEEEILKSLSIENISKASYAKIKIGVGHSAGEQTPIKIYSTTSTCLPLTPPLIV